MEMEFQAEWNRRLGHHPAAHNHEPAMNLTADKLTYRWIADWAKIPANDGHAHHSILVMEDGSILTGHATEAKIMILDAETGAVKREFAVPVNETHGMCLALENGKEVLWIADVGGKDRDHGGPQVVKLDLNGKVLARVTREQLGYAADAKFGPTTVAVDPRSGNVWITDGYGSGLTHRLSHELKLLKTIDGTDGLGRFNCPHWVYVDTRKPQSEVWIADRGNNRVQIYSADGKFLRGISEGLITPSIFASFGEYMVIGELQARVVILDGKNRIIGTLGAGQHHVAKPGWPNRKDAAGATISPLADIPVGEFNSPHGMCADAKGNIYVSEWLLGDRFTKLELVTV